MAVVGLLPFLFPVLIAVGAAGLLGAARFPHADQINGGDFRENGLLIQQARKNHGAKQDQKMETDCQVDRQLPFVGPGMDDMLDSQTRYCFSSDGFGDHSQFGKSCGFNVSHD